MKRSKTKEKRKKKRNHEEMTQHSTVPMSFKHTPKVNQLEFRIKESFKISGMNLKRR